MRFRNLNRFVINRIQTSKQTSLWINGLCQGFCLDDAVQSTRLSHTYYVNSKSLLDMFFTNKNQVVVALFTNDKKRICAVINISPLGYNVIIIGTYLMDGPSIICNAFIYKIVDKRVKSFTHNYQSKKDKHRSIECFYSATYNPDQCYTYELISKV